MKKIRRYVDIDGRRYWYSADTEKLAHIERQRLVERIRAESLSDDTVTFREWTEKWSAIYRAEESIPMRKQNQGRLEKYVMPYIGGMKMVRIKPMHIQEIFSQTASMSYSMNHKLYITLNQIFERALDNDVITKSPMRGVKKPRGKNGTNRALTDDERSALLDAVTDDSASMMVMLMLYCGLRPQEVASLDWKSIDIKKRRISIVSALKSDGTMGSPKSSAGVRKIPIPDALLPYLKRHQSTGYVCLNTHGQHLSSTTIRQAWKRIKRRANLPAELPLYSLRHTYCTDLEQAGVPINIAKLLMGHESIKVTAGIYTHTTDASVEDALTKINQKSTL